MNINPMNIVLNQILNSPIAQNNLPLKNAIEKYKKGDNKGAIEIVQNTLKTNNVDIEKMQHQTENYIKNFMNR